MATSSELIAASKIIGYECSTLNREYFECKKNKGNNPAECKSQADFVTTCATNNISILNEKYPLEYSAFQKCLDTNDFRFKDCRITERALLDCWNKEKNLVKK